HLGDDLGRRPDHAFPTANLKLASARLAAGAVSDTAPSATAPAEPSGSVNVQLTTPCSSDVIARNVAPRIEIPHDGSAPTTSGSPPFQRAYTRTAARLPGRRGRDAVSFERPAASATVRPEALSTAALALRVPQPVAGVQPLPVGRVAVCSRIDATCV